MDFLEMLLEPIAELAFGFFVEGFGSVKDWRMAGFQMQGSDTIWQQRLVGILISRNALL